MTGPRTPDLIAAHPDDAERLASLSRAAKLGYAGWTLIAVDSNVAVGTVHFTNARAERGEGNAIAGRAHLSGLFVLPARWGEGIGSGLLEAALAEMRSRGYRKAQLFTAAANQRSR